jgi:hypothetical protein
MPNSGSLEAAPHVLMTVASKATGLNADYPLPRTRRALVGAKLYHRHPELAR